MEDGLEEGETVRRAILVGALVAVSIGASPAARASERCMGKQPTISGTAADDRIAGTYQNDVIVGGGAMT